MNDFLYRCLNDASYTMIFATESINTLKGYPVADFIANRRRNLASLIHDDDITHVDTAVQKSLVTHTHRTVDYRIKAAEGKAY